MKYFSEITKELYDSKEDLIKAEVKATKAKSDREVKAKEVEKLIKEATEATKKANKALSDFVKEYGGFNTTIKDTPASFWDILDNFMNW